MSSKVNLVLEDEVRFDLTRLVPAGERSRFANDALRERLALLKRGRAIDRLADLRRQGPSTATTEIIRAVRTARNER
jgi:hypothetical protein